MTLLKELILKKQVHLKSLILVTIGIFRYRFKFQHDICNGGHGLLMMSVNPNNIAILNIQGIDYRWIINKINKNDTVNLLKNADLTKEKVVLQKF